MLWLLACAGSGTLPVCYGDADQDGFGSGDPTRMAGCAAGWSARTDDCDDGDGSIRPGQTEACDGIDQDCDGTVDNVETLPRWYADNDGDGDGAGQPVDACPAPAGFVATNGDCDDDDPARSSLTAEVCEDGVDNDCSGADAPCGLRGALGEGDAAAVIYGDTAGREAEFWVGLDHARGEQATPILALKSFTRDEHGNTDERRVTRFVADAVFGVLSTNDGEVLTSDASSTLDLGEIAYLCPPGAAGGLILGVEPDGPGTLGLGVPLDSRGRIDDLIAEFHLTRDADDAAAARLVAADLTADGELDVVVSTVGSIMTPDRGWVEGLGMIQIFAGPFDTSGAGVTAAVTILPGFGYRATSDGDLDGDGAGDLVVASYFEDYTSTVHIQYGPVAPGTGTVRDDATIAFTATLSLGDLASGADLNGDGFDDLAVGVPKDDTMGEDAGAVYVFWGGLAR